MGNGTMQKRSSEHSSKTAFNPKTQIRVLVLHGAETSTAEISATFQFVALPSSSRQQPDTKWEAISYAWEGQLPSCWIKIGGAAMKITANAYAILKTLRHQNTSRCLWIDALCIDQSDVEEKAIQVSMMRSIYEYAQSVIVWLRPETHQGSRTVADAAFWLEELRLNNHKKTLLSDDDPLLSDFRRQVNSIEYCKLPFQNVLELSWFHRIWVVQEAAVASSLFVHLGGQILTWEVFSSAVLRFMSYLPAATAIDCPLSECFVAARDVGHGSDSPPQAALTMVKLIMDLRAWLHSPKPAYMAPSELVALCKDRQASNPLDMIYAVCGLFSLNYNSRYTLGRKLDSFPINYRASPAEVYMNFTVWCIQQEGNLDVLAQLRYEGRYRSGIDGLRGLPTWAADWTCSAMNDFNFLLTEHHLGYVTSLSRPFNSPHSPRFRREDIFLVLRGFVVDTFSEVEVIPQTEITSGTEAELEIEMEPDRYKRDTPMFSSKLVQLWSRFRRKRQNTGNIIQPRRSLMYPTLTMRSFHKFGGNTNHHTSGAMGRS
ncbi:heterokaryon incompatibility protein-domain-containing protein [Xylariales sp. PMI_506]|nr:heterokaryon incompatibility protein-domain-containing protein [Xylariales sp. PMI_506]